MKKRVLFITPSLRQGGVEHSLITVLKRLDTQAYDITLFLYTDMLDLLPHVPDYVKVIVSVDKRKHYRKPYVLFFLALEKTCNVLGKAKVADRLRQKVKNYIHEKKTSWPVSGALRRQHFDIVISYSLHIGTEMALKIPARKHIVFMHSSKPEYHRDIAEKTLMYYDQIVAVGEGVCQVYKDAYPEYIEKITRLDNYVDGFVVRKKVKETPIPFEKEKTILCTCGRLSEEKGFDMALKAAYLLKSKGIDFRWYFVGDGQEREKLETIIKRLSLEETIVITGFQSNPYVYIGNADAYIQTSYEEAQPLVLIEALKLGIPIVSTATVGGNSVLQNGKWGILTDVNAEALADGIERLLSDDGLKKSMIKPFSEAEEKEEEALYIQKWDELLS